MQRCTYENTKKVLNNEDALSYYLLGAFITDGNLIQDKSRTNSFKISLYSKDIDWLKLIQQKLGGDGSIRNANKNCYGLFLYGKDIYDWFIKHKCTPNKSLTLELPDIPDLYFGDFLRGCIDGDGHISLSPYKSSKNNKIYYQSNINLCTSSANFASQLSSKLENMELIHNLITIKTKPRTINGTFVKGGNAIYRIVFSGFKRGIPLLKSIYDNNIIAMPRKQIAAQQIIDYYKRKNE